MNDEAKRDVPEQELGEGNATIQEDTTKPEVGEVDTSNDNHNRAEGQTAGSAEGQAEEKASNPKARKAADRVSMKSGEHDFLNSPADFNKEEMCVNGGRIDKIIEELYKACDEEGIPCLAYINYALINHEDRDEVAMRGMNVSVDGWMPPPMKAMTNIATNGELVSLVNRLSEDPLMMMMMKMVSLRSK